MGRKKKVITESQWKKIGGYALDGCQNGTIAALMDWDREFIDTRKDILTFLHKKRAKRKLKLRKAQNTKALDAKDTTMQIFLGKNVLKQADKTETKHSGEIQLQPPTIT